MRGAAGARTSARRSFLVLSLAAMAAAGVQEGVREEMDVPYGGDPHPRRMADLYLPGGNGWSSLVFVHGGSLTGGDRKGDSIPAVCRRLAADGIGCVSVGYRLFDGDVRWPTPAEDVADAYAWARQAVVERGGHPQRIYLGGHSSGCLLSTVVGASVERLAARGLSPRDVPGIVAMGCRLDFIHDTVGVDRSRIERYFEEHPDGRDYGSLAARIDATSMTHVGPDLPPVLVLIAEEERFQPPILADAERYRDRARAAGRDVVRIEVLPDRRHVTALYRMQHAGDPALTLIEDFVRR